ncbi:hypothetical protein V2J09_018972 [Rumex salicifolius]
MKIQCSVCEVAEAAVLCCADEAALCSDCDRKVHAANKLASKHERIPLANSSSQMPYCDICQFVFTVKTEMVGYFFCLEDRALMCRKCDIAIHTANPNVSSHQRFLLTGVRIGLEPSEPSPSSSMGKSLSVDKVSAMNTHSTSKTSGPTSLSSLYDNMVPVKSKVGNLTPAKRSPPLPLSEEGTEVPPVFGWTSRLQPCLEFADHGSTKADGSKLGVSVSSIARPKEDNLNLDKCLSQEPDISWSVPQALSWPSTSAKIPPIDMLMILTTSLLSCIRTSNKINQQRKVLSGPDL